jgi:endonuclease/exonuclease/phosphatase family metal-dependent hydrolase
MQEINYGLNTFEDLRKITDDVCGPDCTMARGAGQIPNGVISRYPVLASGTWVDPKVQNRDFTWARIDIPGPLDLWAVSVHLLTSSEAEREQEAAALVAALQAAVPAGDLLVMGGDFNTKSRDELALTTLAARFSVTGPYAADGDGNDSTNTARTKPYDWVLASPELRALETSVIVGASHFDTGLVVDTRVYAPLSDLSPAELTDSEAPNMQHMAVVRDFFVASDPVTSGGI